MALCRCITHQPRGVRGNAYLYYVKPIGYPDTSSICGNPKCDKPGYIWLKENEINNFAHQNAIIKYPTGATKVKAENEIYNR